MPHLKKTFVKRTFTVFLALFKFIFNPIKIWKYFMSIIFSIKLRSGWALVTEVVWENEKTV